MGRSRSADAIRRARAVRLAAVDVDGTLTDGRIFIGPGGEAMKAFSVHDGLGLSLLRRAGIRVAIITARRSEIVERRAAELGIADVMQGVAAKADALEELARRAGVGHDALAFMGDDLPDLPALRLAGFAACVADASPDVVAASHWVAAAGGGAGAVREFAEFVLHAQDRWQGLVAAFRGTPA